MKAMKYLFLIVLLLFCSCDTIYMLYIQNTENYFVLRKYGAIKIYGTTMNGLSPVISFLFDREYNINLDPLKMIYSNKNTISSMWIYLNSKRIVNYNNRIITVNKDDVFSIGFYGSGDFFIIPSNFIECNGEAVITDTIKIQTTQIRRNKVKNN